MSQHQIEVAFDSSEALEDFFESKAISNGTSVRSQGATFTIVDYEEHKGFGLDTIVSIATDVAAGVAAHFITDWLLHKLGQSAKYVRYKGELYQITKEDMARLTDVLRKE